jgi:hypothetical protein
LTVHEIALEYHQVPEFGQVFREEVTVTNPEVVTYDMVLVAAVALMTTWPEVLPAGKFNQADSSKPSLITWAEEVNINAKEKKHRIKGFKFPIALVKINWLIFFIQSIL